MTLLSSACQGRNQESGAPTVAAPEAVVPVAEGERLRSFSQHLETSITRLDLKPGATAQVPFVATNMGTQPWYGRAKQLWVDAAYRIHDTDDNLVEDGKRAILSRPVVNPGEKDQLTLTITAPKKSGEYRVIISMVQEGATWFYYEGSPGITIPLIVSGR